MQECTDCSVRRQQLALHSSSALGAEPSVFDSGAVTVTQCSPAHLPEGVCHTVQRPEVGPEGNPQPQLLARHTFLKQVRLQHLQDQKMPFSHTVCINGSVDLSNLQRQYVSQTSIGLGDSGCSSTPHPTPPQPRSYLRQNQPHCRPRATQSQQHHIHVCTLVTTLSRDTLSAAYLWPQLLSFPVQPQSLLIAVCYRHCQDIVGLWAQRRDAQGFLQQAQQDKAPVTRAGFCRWHCCRFALGTDWDTCGT